MPWIPLEPQPAAGSSFDLDRIAQEEGADPHLIRAVMGAESSGGKNTATSPDGARGHMQIIPDTFKRFAREGEAIDDPIANIRVGARYLKHLAGKLGNDPFRIGAAYLSGEGNVDEFGIKNDAVKDSLGTKPSDHGRNIAKRYRELTSMQTANAESLPSDTMFRPKKAPTPPTATQDGEFWRGALRGTFGTDQKSAGAALEMLGVELGNDRAIALGEHIQSLGDDQWKQYAPKVQSVFDVDSAGKGVDWFLGAAGEAVGTSLPSLIGGGAGALAGSPLGPMGTMIGAGTGATLPSYAMNAADVYSSLKDDPEIRRMIANGEMDRKQLADAAAIAGIPMSLLDVYGLGKVTGAIGAAARGNLASRIAKHIVQSGFSEGWTEGTQEIISQWTQQYMGGNKSFEEQAKAVIENVAAGMAGGVAMGSASAPFRAGGQKAPGTEPPPETPEPNSGTPAPNTGTPTGGGWVPMPGDMLAAEDVLGGEPSQSIPFRSNRTPVEPAPFRSNRTDTAPSPVEPAYASGAEPPQPEGPPSEGTAPVAPPITPSAAVAPPEAAFPPANIAPPPQGEKESPFSPPAAEPAQSAPDPAERYRVKSDKGEETLTEVRALTQALFDQYIAPGLRTPMSFADYVAKYPAISHLAFTSADGREWKPAKPFVGNAKRLRPADGELVTAEPPKPVAESVAQPELIAPLAPATVDDTAHTAATSPQNDLPEPTPLQKQNGNYAKGHAKISGLDLAIENPEGSVRKGTDASGKDWESTLKSHYGYIKRTAGADGDHLDAFVKPGTATDWTGTVFVVDQVHPDTGAFDEHKAMLGYDSIEEAKQAYRENYAKGWKGLKTISATPLEEFKTWLKDGDLKKPFHADPEPVAPKVEEPAPEPKVGINLVINKLGPDGLTDEERAAGKKPYTDAADKNPDKPRTEDAALAADNLRTADTADDLDAMFDDVLAEEKAKDAAKVKKATKARMIPTRNGVVIQPIDENAKPVGVPYMAGDKPEPKAGESAASAIKNAAAGLNDAIDGLGALFGGKGKLGSGPVFDEETYAKARPLFQQAIAHFKDAGTDLKEAMRAIVRMVLDKFGADAAANMKPYVVRFLSDARDGNLYDGDSSNQPEKANGPESGAADESGPVEVPSVGEGGGTEDSRRGRPGERGASGPAGGVLEGGPAGDVEPAGEPATGSGDRSDQPDGDGRGGKPEGGNVPNRRPRGSRKGLADDGAGGARDVAPAKQKTLGNYHIADPEQLIGGSPLVRFKRNRAAIEALRAIEDEGRDATPEERDALARYIGWGSFGQELFNGSWDYPRPKEGWEEADKWLRAHMGQKEWESAQRSIINAHYTDPPTVQAMWEMLQHMGFKGGKVLEPSIGIGNFFGLMPREIMARSSLAGIELDSLTGRMAQLLYPDANIQIKGYQDSKTADNFYDVVIGNWPFAAQGPTDRRYRLLSPTLHDYFFLKAVDQVRPGGIVIGITSSGTMDKQGKLTRLELARKADLVAAFRLPSGAFEKYAGTSVVTDIIVLQKRESPNPNPQSAGWIEVDTIETPAGPEIKVNEYYVRHREDVLGTLNWGHGTTRGQPGMIVDRPDDLMKRLEELPSKVPEGRYIVAKKQKVINYVTNNSKDRENSVTTGNAGRLFVVRGEYMAPLHEIHDYRLKDSKKTAARERQIKALIEMRRAYGALIDAERASDESTEAKRKTLGDLYAKFTKEHGLVTDSDGLAVLRKVQDPFYPSLAALEVAQKGKMVPAKILSEPTMRQKRKMDKPSISDAFVMARNESLNIDPASIAKAAGVKESDVISELTGSGVLFKTPDGVYEARDVYLSGNVRRKLREAQEAKEQGQDMDANIEALKSVMPPDVPYFNIEAKLGAPWVSTPQYRQYVADLLNLTEQERESVDIAFRLGSWKIKFNNPNLMRKPEARGVWGTEDIDFDDLLKGAFNNTPVTVWGKDSDGNRFVREAETKLANEKIARLREEFSVWVWKDMDRRFALEKEYNETMNAESDPQFDGSFLTLEGMALQRGENQFALRRHQVNAIWRGLVNRRGLYAHEVGTGKTYTMGGLAIESRRYGIAKKPLIFAHNANSASVAREIQEMYPAAKVLYLSNLNKEELPIALRQIANDDWDAIVVPHPKISQFGLTRPTLEKMAASEIAALEQEAIEAAAAKGISLTVDDMDAMQDPQSKVGMKVRDATAKELVKARNAVIARIDDMAARAAAEGAIPFEELGVDMIIVDEAHNFGKPPLSTKMKLRGLNKSISNRSLALWFLTGYVRSLNGGQGVHLFTGTPITNTLNEIFNHQRYVAEDIMIRDGVKDWDSWFNTFADSSTDVELTAAGQYEPVTRLASFVNTAELRRMIGSYTDIVFADDMPEFQPRTTASGKVMNDKTLTDEEMRWLVDGRTEAAIGRPYKKIINDVGPMSPAQERVLEHLQKLANEFKQAGGKERMEMMRSGHPASPVIVETNAGKAGLDARLYRKDLPDHPMSKVNRAVKNLLKHYHEHPEATQVVFMERGFSDVSVRVKKNKDGTVTRTKVEKFNLVDDLIEKLVDQGIPKEQIAIVAGGVTPEKKKQIADAMNAAQIRIVIGQTETLGVGVNMQKNLRAMHHLDAPWRPGDLEQRNGRGHRQGNQWNTVLEYRYIVDRIDGRRWQVLAVKDRFIKRFLKADNTVRVIEGDAASMDEDSDILSSLSEASGDPRILLLNKYKQDVERLESRQRTHGFGVQEGKERLRKARSDAELKKKAQAGFDSDAAAVALAREKDFSATIGGKAYTNRKEFDEALAERIKVAVPKQDWQTLGEIYGFTIRMEWLQEAFSPKYHVKRNLEYRIGTSAASMESVLRNIGKQAEKNREETTSLERSIPSLEESIKAPFPRAADLEKKRELYRQVEADLDINPQPAPSWLRQGTPIGTDVFVDGTSYPVEGHQYAQDGYFVLVSTDAGARRVPFARVKDENGMPVYEPKEFVAPVKQERPIKKGQFVIRNSDKTRWKVLTDPKPKDKGGPLMALFENTEDESTITAPLPEFQADTSVRPVFQIPDLEIADEPSQSDESQQDGDTSVTFAGWDSADTAVDGLQYDAPVPRAEVKDSAHDKVFTAARDAFERRRTAGNPLPGRLFRWVKPRLESLPDAAAARGRDVRAAEEIAGFFGHEVVWFEALAPERANAGGFVGSLGGNRIFLNLDNRRPHMMVVGHELLHRMKTERPDLYAQFRDTVQPLLQNQEQFSHPMAEQGSELFLEELLADFTGWNMMRRDFWREMARKSPARFQKIADWVLSFLDALVLRFRGKVGDHGRYFTDVKAAQTALVEALAEFRRPDTSAVVAPVDGAKVSFAQADPPIVRQSYKNAAAKAIDWLDTKMDSIGLLPSKKEYLAQRYETLGKIAKVDEIAAGIKKVFSTASATDKQAAYGFFTTRGASPNAIASEAVRREAVKVKSYIESVGDALVERGLLSPDARETHRGAYLPRLYLKYLLSDGDWKLLGAGKKPSDMGYLKQRKDIPEEYRRVILGEIKDPGFLSGMAIAKPMRDMALLDFLEQISRNQDWILPNSTLDWRGKRVTVHWAKAEAKRLRAQSRHMEAVDAAEAKKIADELDSKADEYLEDIQGEHADYRQIPDTARYGRLRGLYVRKEIYNDLMGVNDFLPVDPGFFQSVFGYGGVGSRVTSMWKLGKVALNPPAQFRNFISNFVLLQLSGVPLHRCPGRVMQAWSEIVTNGPHFQVAKKYGVTESTFTAQEIWRMKRDLLELEHASGLLDVWGKAKLMAATITDGAGDLYQFMEALFKTAKIIDEMNKGASGADAAMEAQKWLFDYSLVPKEVRYARSAPIGMPFLTFTWKVIPRMAEVAVKHPQRFIPWVALAYGLPMLVASNLDVDDDDLEKLKKALPDWLQERGHAYVLPWKDEQGRWQVIDLGYFFPWTTITEPLRNLVSGEPGKVIQGVGMFSGPITEMLIALKTGKDSFTGRDIYSDGDPPKRQLLSILNYLWTMAMPPVITEHGAVGHAIRSYTGTTNKFGDPLSTAEQAVLRFFGVNIYAMNPSQSRMQNLTRMQREITDTRLLLIRRLQDQSRSPEQRLDIVNEYKAEMVRRQQKLQEYLKDSEIDPKLQ